MLGQIYEEAGVGSNEQLSNFSSEQKLEKEVWQQPSGQTLRGFLLHLCFRLGFTGRMKRMRDAS